MSFVGVNTYAYSVTYLAENILNSLTKIIRLSGLDPAQFVDRDGWASKMLAIKTLLASEHLEMVKLEIFNPATGAFITRWDIGIAYNWSGDGGFWADTEAIKYAILKHGIAPASAGYRLLLTVKPGAETIAGWNTAQALSTAGFVRQSIGSNINHNGLAANTSYWRPAV